MPRFERSSDGIRWEPVDEVYLRKVLSAVYRDVDAVILDMAETGHPASTGIVQYRYVNTETQYMKP